jgi:hypothetical protein
MLAMLAMLATLQTHNGEKRSSLISYGMGEGCEAEAPKQKLRSSKVRDSRSQSWNMSDRTADEAVAGEFAMRGCCSTAGLADADFTCSPLFSGYLECCDLLNCHIEAFDI